MDPNAPSYVERQADHELLQALLDREYVFLLDSRQKGKSSLIARTLMKLRERGVRTIKLDLQRIGSNVTPDQWYAGMLHEIGLELGSSEAIFKTWSATQHIGPLARFVGALGQAITSVDDSVVLFVDEIDFVRALPFSADEFFAAIRDCFNRRSDSAAYQRLTFCLAGVATPSQLIQNPEITPFNVGRRIDLEDFTEDDLVPFAKALDKAHLPGVLILSRVHHWVEGHPYLTQSLCAAALESSAIFESDVDALVDKCLTAAEQRQRDPNLADVERRLLEPYAPGFSPEDARSRVLEVYRRLLRNQQVGTDFDDPAITTLLLAGVAKDRAGRLVIRNRVYEVVFNERWRQASLPDAEKRRQRAAFRRGAMRVGLVAGAILIVVGSLTVKLAFLAAERDDALTASRAATTRAELAAYSRTVALIETEAKNNRWTRVHELFEDLRASKYRGWEYGYWLNRVDGHEAEVDLGSPVRQIVSLPSGRLVVDATTGVFVLRPDLKTVDEHRFPGCRIALSGPSKIASVSPIDSREFRILGLEDSRVLWSGSIDSNAGLSLPYLMDRDQQKLTGTLSKFDGDGLVPLGKYALPSQYLHTRASPSGRYLFLTRVGGTVLVDRKTGRRTEISDDFFNQTNAVCFDKAETRCWIGTSSDQVREFHMPHGTEVRRFGGYQSGVNSVELDSAEQRLLTASEDGTVVITDLSTGLRVRTISAHGGTAVATWGPDPSIVVTGGASGKVKRFDLRRPDPSWELPAAKGQVGRSMFTSDSRRLITLSQDGFCRLFDVSERKLIAEIALTGAPPPGYLKMSKSEQFAFAGGNQGEVVCFETRSGRVRWRSPALGSHVTGLGLSPDEKILLVGTDNGVLAKIDTDTGRVAIQRPFGKKPIRGCTFSADGSTVVFGCWRDLFVVRTEGLVPVRQLSNPGEDGDIRTLSLSSDGERLLVSRTIKSAEYRMSDLRLLRTFEGHTRRMFSARYSPSERLVYTFGMDGKVRVVDRVSGRLLFEALHDSWVSAAEMTADESRLITSSDDGSLRLWSTTTGEQVASLPGNGSTIFNVALSRDESMIATSAQDGRVVVYVGLPKNQIGRAD